jgi:hypothetical protein
MAAIRSAVFPVIPSKAEAAPMKTVISSPVEKPEIAQPKMAVTPKPMETEEADIENVVFELKAAKFGFYQNTKMKISEPAKLGQYIDIRI